MDITVVISSIIVFLLIAYILVTMLFIAEKKLISQNDVEISINDDPEAIKDALVRQLYFPVRWTETVEKLAEMGVEAAYEVGPGKVLTGLSKRITKAFGCQALNTPEAFETE